MRLLFRTCSHALAVLALAGSVWAGQPVITRGPYLQQGTPHGIVVRWRTDLATDSRVLYGPAPGNLGSSAYDPSQTTEHVVTLSGLDPDTRYYYGVGTDAQLLAGNDANHFFLTAPFAGTAKPTRVWVLGDSGTANQNALDVRDAYYDFSDGRHTDLWLMLGDNAYPDGSEADYQAALFDIFQGMLRKSVLWPTFGNHEGLSSSSASQSGPYYDIFSLPAAGEAGGEISGTEAYYSFDYANVHFIVLNSMDVDRTPPDSAMLDWLEQDLLNQTTQDWIIALWHHPPYSKGSHDSDNLTLADHELVEMRQYVLPLLEDHGVDLTLTGHSHSYERSFLIDGHHNYSWDFGPEHVVDGGDGREEGDGAYVKPLLGVPNQGAVHTVAGSAGQITGGALNHPAMFLSLNVLGSLVIDIDDLRLDAYFVDSAGDVEDHFTLIKGCQGNDVDLDLYCDSLDNCPDLANPEQENADGDGLGDVCDPCPLDPQNDGDVDGLCANVDNCPLHFNPSQLDTDGDAAGDPCDADDDNDYVSDAQDCAPLDRGVSAKAGSPGSTLRLDRFGGGRLRWQRGAQGHTSNVYRGQILSSHVLTTPICLSSENPELEKRDAQPLPPGGVFYYLVSSENLCGESTMGENSAGQSWPQSNACVPVGEDFDQDGVLDLADNCALWPNLSQDDADHDFVGNPCDNCSSVQNSTQWDCDGDGTGDVCDVAADCDADGVPNLSDNCLYASNADQLDAEGDGVGDDCDNCPAADNPGQENIDGDNPGDACDSCTDTDADGFANPGFPASTCPLDNCPAVANASQGDLDGDSAGDDCDSCTDTDADGFANPGFPASTCPLDNCPAVVNASQGDLDGDSAGDDCDSCTDTDADGFANPGFPASTCPLDNCPATANLDQADHDQDGAGNVCDDDDDNDGALDAQDCMPLTRGVSSPPQPIEESLRLQGKSPTTLRWLRSYQGHTANVYVGQGLAGGSAVDDLSCLTIETPGTLIVDAAPNPGRLMVYLISSRNACGESEAGEDGQGNPTLPEPPCGSLGADDDGDGIPSLADNCAGLANAAQLDSDADFVGDACDNCPAVFNPDQSDVDGDQQGDACEP